MAEEAHDHNISDLGVNLARLQRWYGSDAGEWVLLMGVNDRVQGRPPPHNDYLPQVSKRGTAAVMNDLCNQQLHHVHYR